MKRLPIVVFVLALIIGTVVSMSRAADCPQVLTDAKAALRLAQAQLTAKMQEVQAPRTQAGARQDIQAPKMQEVQAPKMQEVQAPKMQEVQAPRVQGAQAPRVIQASNVSKARELIRQSEQACKRGDMKASAEKAQAALALLK